MKLQSLVDSLNGRNFDEIVVSDILKSLSWAIPVTAVNGEAEVNPFSKSEWFEEEGFLTWISGWHESYDFESLLYSLESEFWNRSGLNPEYDENNVAMLEYVSKNFDRETEPVIKEGIQRYAEELKDCRKNKVFKISTKDAMLLDRISYFPVVFKAAGSYYLSVSRNTNFEFWLNSEGKKWFKDNVK